jgi:DNA adenine methylase
MKSPLRWVGGKNAEADYLATLLPEHSCYVEVFGGGASVLLAKRPSEVEVYNDLNGELVNFFRVVKERPAEFKAAWRWCLVSREEFCALRDSSLEELDAIQRAYRFMYLNRVGFSGEMSKPSFGVTARDESLLVTWLENLEVWVNGLHNRLKRCYIENQGFYSLINQWGTSVTGKRGQVFFLDPPYFETREYATGTLTEEDHRKLATTLGGLKERFLLTINDHPTIRALYAGCHLMERTKQYSISKSAEARKEYAELIISNYTLPTSKQATLF